MLADSRAAVRRLRSDDHAELRTEAAMAPRPRPGPQPPVGGQGEGAGQVLEEVEEATEVQVQGQVQDQGEIGQVEEEQLEEQQALGLVRSQVLAVGLCAPTSLIRDR